MSDKPGHVLEIPASLGRDIDKGLAPPIEAFMSDSALEQVERSTRAATEPVHAEDLKPISRAEAAARTTFDGTRLPAMPSTRRVIPAPFQRPRVRGGRHGKTWQRVRADQVQAGDIITDLGRVTAASGKVLRDTVAGIGDVAVGVVIEVTGAGGVRRTFSRDEQVQVFRA